MVAVAASIEPAAGHGRPDAAATRSAAEALAAALAEGWSDRAERHLLELTRLHESALYAEVGRLARDLHSALRGFALDPRLAALAECELADARSRLAHVCARTEEATHRTLAATERAQEIARELDGRAARLAARLENGATGAGPAAGLLAEIEGFLDHVRTASAALGAELTEAILAQEFQDLTGQVLCRVTALVEELEGHLLRLLRMGPRGGGPGGGKERPPAAEGAAIGTATGRVSGQDEVDELLADLGF